MDCLKGKKLLILGGKPIGSVEIVTRAKQMGAYTIVADFLSATDSPAKRIADESWDISTADIDILETKAREAGVDGVYAGVHEFNIRKMIELCGRLNLPCFCRLDQWDALQNKINFKSVCRDNGIPVTREFRLTDNNISDDIEYPVIVKPADGSGSSGFSICNNASELSKAYDKAVSFSETGSVLVETFMDYRYSVIINYTLIDGKVIYGGMSDKRSKKVFEDGSPIMSFQVYPSEYEKEYLDTIDEKAKGMLKSLGLKNGVVWIEAFCKDGKFTFNEMGFRFGGSLTYYPIEYYTGLNQLDLQIEYALTGHNDMVGIDMKANPDNDGRYCILPTHVKPGKIDRIEGLDELSKKDYYYRYVPVHYEGDTIQAWGNARQVLAYIHFVVNSKREIDAVVKDIMETLHVFDEDGNEMLFNLYEPELGRSTLLLSSDDQRRILSGNLDKMPDIVENAFKKYRDGKVLLPDKVSVIFNEEKQNRINCMPGAILDDNIYGVKWISVFPDNPMDGYNTVNGTIILSELTHGYTLSVMDAGYLTEIRTASVGAVAAKYLSREDAETIGFIGAGRQARNHLDLIMCVRPGIKKCYVSSRADGTVERFIKEGKEKHPGIEFINCGEDYEAAVTDADIIVTAISAQKDILKARWIKKGALYIHVAGWEDEYAVANSASKIICDDWESVKHRTQTISRMYKEGLIKDEDIYGNLDEIIAGVKAGREDDGEFIYFCSVGLAFIDISFAEYVYKKADELGLGTIYSFTQ